MSTPTLTSQEIETMEAAIEAQLDQYVKSTNSLIMETVVECMHRLDPEKPLTQREIELVASLGKAIATITGTMGVQVLAQVVANGPDAPATMLDPTSN